MSYASYDFIFYSLFVLVTFACIPKSWRVPWLAIASVIWYASWDLTWAAFLSLIVGLNVLTLRFISSSESATMGKRALWGLLVFDIVYYIFLKAGGFGRLQFEPPFGTSIFMFIIFALVVDRMREANSKEMPDSSGTVLLPMFFPLMMGGPIERMKSFGPQLKSGLRFKPENVADGVLIFSFGFLKRTLVSPGLDTATALLFEESQRNHFMVPLLAVLKTFQAYVEFSSYCDMGRGVARFFDIRLGINFRPFYYAKDPNDFWRRWNITLGTWIRDYISFPSMLRWGRVIHQNWILLASFVVVGIWHGVTWNWLAFGLFNGLIIILFNTVQRYSPRGRWFGFLGVFLIVVGNGLLQQPDILMGLAKGGISHASAVVNPAEIGLIFYLALFGTLAFDFVHEKMMSRTTTSVDAADWYLLAPKTWRFVAAGLLLVWLFWFLDGQAIRGGGNDKPPAYFQI